MGAGGGGGGYTNVGREGRGPILGGISGLGPSQSQGGGKREAFSSGGRESFGDESLGIERRSQRTREALRYFDHFFNTSDYLGLK